MNDWKIFLAKRLIAEAQAKGKKQIDVCNIRKLRTNPVKMYAVVVADCSIFALNGYCENDMASKLQERIDADRQSTAKELIYLQ